MWNISEDDDDAQSLSKETGHVDKITGYETQGNIPDPIIFGYIAPDDPWFQDEYMEMGIEKTDETKSQLLTMMKDSLENCFKIKLEGDMRFLVTDYEDIFRTKLGSEAPANVPPL